MKTAAAIISDHLGGNLNIATLTLKGLEEIINVARKKTIQACAEKARVIQKPYFDAGDDEIINGSEVWEDNGGDCPSYLAIVDKQSILSIIKELK